MQRLQDRELILRADEQHQSESEQRSVSGAITDFGGRVGG
jgi:hypothetical protein